MASAIPTDHGFALKQSRQLVFMVCNAVRLLATAGMLSQNTGVI
jgi:hypothetical protein